MTVILDSRSLYHDLLPLLDHIVENPIDPIYNNIVLVPTGRIIVAYSGNGRTLCRVILRSKATVLALPPGCEEFFIPATLVRKLLNPSIEGTLSIEVDAEQSHFCIKSSQLDGKWVYEKISTDSFIKVPVPPAGIEPISLTAEQLKYITTTLLPMAGYENFNDYCESGISFIEDGSALKVVAVAGGREKAVITISRIWPYFTEKEVPAYLFETIKNHIYIEDHIYPEKGSFLFYFTSSEVFVVGGKFLCYSTLNPTIDNNLRISREFELKVYDGMEYSYMTDTVTIKCKEELINALECCLAFNNNDNLIIEFVENGMSLSAYIGDGSYCQVKVGAELCFNSKYKYKLPPSKCIDGSALLKVIRYCAGKEVELNLSKSPWNASKMYFIVKGEDRALNVYLELYPVSPSIVQQTKNIAS